MNDLQVAAPVTPASSTKSVPPSAETPEDSAVLPWAVAFQAALTQHAKTLIPDSAPGATAQDSAGPEADEQLQIAARDAPAAQPAVVPLPLLPALLTAPPAAPAEPPLTAQASTGRPADASAIAAPSDAFNGTTGAATGQRTAPGHAPPDTHAVPALPISAYTLKRDQPGPDTSALPQVQVASAQGLALAPPPLAAPVATPSMATAPVQIPAMQLQVDAAVGAAAWGTELGQKVAWMIGEKLHVAELRVNPPDLGPLEIKLTVTDNETTAVFTSPHGAVRDAVESALPRLREILAESGVMLGNASVTADSPRDGSAFASSRENLQHATGSAGALESAATGASLITGKPSRRNGLVDLFA